MSVDWLIYFNLGLCIINAAMAFFLASQLRVVANLYHALIYLAVHSQALRHCWKAQIIALMTVVDKETVSGSPDR